MIKTINIHLKPEEVAGSEVIVSAPSGDYTPRASVFFAPHSGDLSQHWQGTVSISFPSVAAFKDWCARMQREAGDAFDKYLENTDLCGGGDLPEAA